MKRSLIISFALIFILLLSGVTLAAKDIVIEPTSDDEVGSYNDLPPCPTDHKLPGLRFLGSTDGNDIKYSQLINFNDDQPKQNLLNKINDPSNNKCSDSTYFQVEDHGEDNTYGVLVGGYLYVLEEIDLTLAYQINDVKKVGDNCWDTKHTDRNTVRWSSSGISFAVYDVDATGNLGDLHKSYFSFDSYCAETGDDEGFVKLIESASDKTSPNRILGARTEEKYIPPPVSEEPLTLQPGIYFIYLDVMVEADASNNNGDSSVRVNLNDGRFLKEDEWGGTESRNHLKNVPNPNRISSSKYFIVPSFLTDEELLDVLDAEGMQALCEDAEFAWSTEVAKLYPQKACCGDSADDAGYIDPVAGLVCNMDDGWVPFLDDYYDEETGETSQKGYCSENFPGADALSYAEAEGLSLNYAAQGGNDGCCGDDRNCYPKETVFCSNLPSNMAEEINGCYDGGYAVYVGSPSRTVLEGCRSLTEEECTNDYYSYLCNWDTSSSDNGFIAPGGDYFCGKDYYNLDGVDKIVLAETSSWQWWDATDVSASFKIHSINGVDYISNSEEWFYCDATGTVSNSDGTAIPEGDNFSTATTAGTYTCINTLNQIKDSFNMDIDKFSVCEGYPYVSCCQEPTLGETLRYDPTDGFLGEDSVCKTQCYIGTQQTLEMYLENIETEGPLGAYCVLYPFDSSCPESAGSQDPLYDSNEVEKSACGISLQGCLQESPDLGGECQDIDDLEINGQLYSGELCGIGESHEYCVTNQYILSSDVVTSESNKDVCCLVPNDILGDGCEGITKDASEQQCRSAGGDYLPEEQISNSVCEPTNVVIGNCCLGGEWKPKHTSLDSPALNFAQPEAFICYDQADNNYIAECCTDFSVCHNAESSSLFEPHNKLMHGYYGEGGVLHTIYNYDRISNNVVVDYVRIVSTFPYQLEFASSALDIDFRRLADWSTFDYLEFDVAYNLEDKLDALVLYSDSDETHTCTFEDFSNYLTNGKAPMRWHHVVIPLANPTSCDSDFDNTNVTHIVLIGEEGSGLQIVLDNFFLSEDKSKGTLANTENYYCAGNFGQWVSNLDGPTDEGFVSGALMLEKGPYWYACEAQASFDWTGSRCCGDDTRTKGGLGEYYIDTQAACFSGATIYNDMTVGEALNDDAYDDLLYYVNSAGDANFYVCRGNENSYADRFVSYSDTMITENLLVDTSDAYLKTDFDVVGTHLCDSSGSWVSVDSVSKARIIAAKMYNITANEIDTDSPHYSIFCENITNILPTNSYYSIPGLEHVEGNIGDFCVLSYGSSADEPADNVLIGLGLKGTTIEAFLTNLLPHTDAVTTLTNESYDEFATSCNEITAGEVTSDEFFRVCKEISSVPDLRLAYNPEFNILFIAYADNPSDFDNLFGDDGVIATFTQSVVDTLKSWFSSWFGGGSATGADVEWSAGTLLPLFTDDQVDFSRFYLLEREEKTILGIAQTRDNTGYRSQNNLDDGYYTIEYLRIQSSIEPLATRYYGTQTYALNYVYGNASGVEKQALVLVNPNNESLRFGYEKEFDWRRLTAGLVIDPSVVYEEGTYSSTPNNGKVELGEECDYVSTERAGYCISVIGTECALTGLIPESQANNCGSGCQFEPVEEPVDTYVFLYGEDSCEFWNFSYEPDGTVGCEDNKVTYNNCVKKAVAEPVGSEEPEETGGNNPAGTPTLIECGICDTETDWSFVSEREICTSGEVKKTECVLVETFLGCEWNSPHPLDCTPYFITDPIYGQLEDGCEENHPYCTKESSGWDSLCGTDYDYCSSFSTQEACEAKSTYCTATIDKSYVVVPEETSGEDSEQETIGSDDTQVTTPQKVLSVDCADDPKCTQIKLPGLL